MFVSDSISPGRTPPSDKSQAPRSGIGPLGWLAVLFIVGLLLARTGAPLWLWVALSWIMVGGAAVQAVRGKSRGVRTWGYLAVVPLAAAWGLLQTQAIPGRSLADYLTPEAYLAQVTGVVTDLPRLSAPQRGAFAKFASWEQPQTWFVIEAQRLGDGDRAVEVSGRLLVRVGQAYADIRPGDRLELIGWLSAPTGPLNPGEEDFRVRLRERGIAGRLTLDSAGTMRVVERPPVRGSWAKFRRSCGNVVAEALHEGLDPASTSTALLDALLLGRYQRSLSDVEDSFRRIGLTHILSISGAHLAILLGMVWAILRLWVSNPRALALTVLGVMLAYLMILPMQAPILRSAIMAGVFCLGMAWGRRTAALELLALACVLVLMLRPDDLGNAGFQLSFGITAGLLALTGPLAQRLGRRPAEIGTEPHGWRERVRWYLVNVLAANIVGFAVGLPLVAYHFGMVTPMALLMSVVELPVVTLTLGVGFAKLVLSLLLPSVGLLLAPVLGGLAAGMIGLTEAAARVPWAAVELGQRPGVAWTVGTMSLVLLALGGWFRGRRPALAGAIVVCVLWACLPILHTAWADLRRGNEPDPVVARLHMLAVGDGSCFVLRDATGRTLMFDCGSGGRMDIGPTVILPALRQLGVTRLDTLMLSHVDIDHICGSLDVAGALPVGRVVVSPQFVADATDHPLGPAGFLLEELGRRGIPVQTVSAGWKENWAGMDLELLWPPVTLDARQTRSNDTSLVLSVRVAGRRLLLTGDIQQQAITALLESGQDVQADVMDLAHHGSFVKASPAWLARVNPSVVLQSSGPTRLRHDKWEGVIDAKTCTRLVTQRQGLVSLNVSQTGKIAWECFRDGKE